MSHTPELPSDSEGEHGRIFDIPDQNATPRTLRKALTEVQKVAGAALKQNRVLRAEKAKAEASKPGRRSTNNESEPRGLKGPNTLGYHAVIIPLGKSFTVLEFPWIDTSVFSAQVPFPEVPPSDLWKPKPISPVFPQYLTAAIYKHIPPLYYPLVNFAGEHGRHFAENFCHHSSAERSTALKILKTELPAILLGQKFIADIRDHSAWRALIVLPEDMAKKDLKVSLYPPVIYHKAKKKPTGFMKSAVLPLCARAILWGPASLQDDGSRRPQGSTVGKLWNVRTVNSGLICFICTTVVFICYWMSVGEGKENFEAVGTTSRIDFREIYMRFRRALESKPEEAKQIFRFWHERVFKGITEVPPLPSDALAPGDVDEDEELEKAMGVLDLSDDSLLDSDEEADAPVPHRSVPTSRRVEPLVHNTEHGQLAPNIQGPSTATPGPVSRTAGPSGRVEPGPTTFHAEHAPSTGSDSEIDESIASPARLNRRRNIVYSDDEPSSHPADGGNEEVDGLAEDAAAVHHAEDAAAVHLAEDAATVHHTEALQLETQLKGLKVVKLRSFLQVAQQTIRTKATKNELVTAILASPEALAAYKAELEVA